ncbi:MAG: 4'-phosphopantetheinyl transferase superfamily protein [Caldilineaceae bacterium]
MTSTFHTSRPHHDAQRIDPPLTRGTVHLWRVALDQPQSRVDTLRTLLSGDEIARADGFRFPRHRRRFIVARAALRWTAGAYLQAAPETLRFDYTPHGKPFLPDVPLQFNLSHAGELALLAFAWERPVGVDIEMIRPLDGLEALAAANFAAAEVDALLTLPPPERQRAFFNGWTRKEAFVKAVGDGLIYPLDRFAVSLTPGAPARLLHIDGDANAARQWFMVAFEPTPSSVAALVCAGPAVRLVHFNHGFS